jgi:hypothetical protein
MVWPHRACGFDGGLDRSTRRGLWMDFDLQGVVNGAVEAALKSGGPVEKLVSEQVNKAIAEAFTSQFRSYSDFGKAVQKAVADALTFDPDKFEIQRYHLLIRDVVKRRVEEKMTLEFAVELDKLLADLHEPVPAELKLSELVAAFIEHFEKESYARNRADRISVTVENFEYGYTTIKLHPDGSGKKTYSSHHDMSLFLNKEGNVYAIWISGESIDKKFFLSPKRGFERLLVGLYMQKSRIVMDSYNSAYKEAPEDECSCA